MPNFLHNRCAYHPSQVLTNFCSCIGCLLPVCPTCIKLHSQQHTLKNTSPMYEKIDTVFEQVFDSCANVMKGLSRLKQQLLEVQKVKKQNQSLILQKIKIYRNKLIRQFERALKDLEYEMIKTFQDQAQKFIIQIEDIDRTIDTIYENASDQKYRLQSQQGLKTVIFYMSKRIEVEELRQISVIHEKIKDMLKKNIYLSIEQSAIDQLKINIKNYLRLGHIDWQIHQKNKNPQKTQFSKQQNKNQQQIQNHHHLSNKLRQNNIKNEFKLNNLSAE